MKKYKLTIIANDNQKTYIYDTKNIVGSLNYAIKFMHELITTEYNSLVEMDTNYKIECGLNNETQYVLHITKDNEIITTYCLDKITK